MSFRCPLGGDYPEFGKMSAKSIHGSRALADEKLAGPVLPDADSRALAKASFVSGAP